MTRQKRQGERSAASDSGGSKMAPPPSTPAQQRALGAAARLERYARSTPGRPPCQEGREDEEWSAAEMAEGVEPAAHGDPASEEPATAMHSLLRGDGGLEVGEEGDNMEVAVPSTEPTIGDVFAAVTACSSTLVTLTSHMSGLKEDMAYVRQDVQQIKERMKVAEDRISGVEDRLPGICKDLQSVSQQVQTLLAKVDDLENRSRRNNIRLVGIPEKSEGPDPVSFLEKWLCDVCGSTALSPFFAIERAHRVPTRPLPPGAPPRPMLLKLLHYRDRDTILRIAREKKDVFLNGQKVSVYPDFSLDVQRRRLQFSDIKRRLRSLKVPYSMLFPARLRVAALGNSHFFDSPKAALAWLDANERSIRNSGSLT